MTTKSFKILDDVKDICHTYYQVGYDVFQEPRRQFELDVKVRSFVYLFARKLGKYSLKEICEHYNVKRESVNSSGRQLASEISSNKRIFYEYLDLKSLIDEEREYKSKIEEIIFEEIARVSSNLNEAVAARIAKLCYLRIIKLLQ